MDYIDWIELMHYVLCLFVPPFICFYSFTGEFRKNRTLTDAKKIQTEVQNAHSALQHMQRYNQTFDSTKHSFKYDLGSSVKKWLQYNLLRGWESIVLEKQIRGSSAWFISISISISILYWFSYILDITKSPSFSWHECLFFSYSIM